MSSKPFAFVTKRGKVIGQGLMDQYAFKGEADAGTAQITAEFTSSDYAERGLTSPPIPLSRLANLLTVNTYHLRACKTKARDSAGLGVRIVPTSAEDQDDEQHKADRTRLETWIEEQEQGLSTTLERAQMDFESMGIGIVEMTYDPITELPSQLYHVPAESMRVHKNKGKWMQRVGSKFVWFRSLDHGREVHKRTGQEFLPGTLDPSLLAHDVFWWNNYHPNSRTYGLPDIVPAISAIVGDVSRRDYNIAFFENYGVPAYAVFITGDFDPGEPELLPDDEEGVPTGPTPLESAIEEHFQSMADNPHGILVLSIPTSITDDFGGDGGKVEVRIEPLSVDVKDASFRMYRQDNRDEILSAHGVDPYRVGISEVGSLGGSTAAEASAIYKESVIEPRQQIIEDLINRRIVRDKFEITAWKIELEELDTTDVTADVALVTTLFALGAITPAEIAKLFATRFGIDTTKFDHPALQAHYVGGQPVDAEISDMTMPGDQVMAALNSAKDELEKLVAKREANGHQTVTEDDIRRIAGELITAGE